MPKSCKLVRLNVSGDFLTEDEKIDYEILDEIQEFASKRKDTLIWGYTHCWSLIGENPFKNTNNVQLFASTDSEEQIREAKGLGYRVAHVSEDPNKNLVTDNSNFKYCPVDYQKYQGMAVKEINVSCASCKLCIEDNSKDIIFLKT